MDKISLYHIDEPEQQKNTAQQDYDSLVNAVLSTPKGQELVKHMETWLQKPTWNMGESTECAIYREGARRYVLDLLNSAKRAKM